MSNQLWEHSKTWADLQRKKRAKNAASERSLTWVIDGAAVVCVHSSEQGVHVGVHSEPLEHVRDVLLGEKTSSTLVVDSERLAVLRVHVSQLLECGHVIDERLERDATTWKAERMAYS